MWVSTPRHKLHNLEIIAMYGLSLCIFKVQQSSSPLYSTLFISRGVLRLLTQKTRINITVASLCVLLSITLHEKNSFKSLIFLRENMIFILITNITSIRYNTLHRFSRKSNTDLMNHD